MKTRAFLVLFLPICICFAAPAGISRLDPDTSQVLKQHGSYYTGAYANLFADLLGKTPAEVKALLDRAFIGLFHGDDATERVYYPVEPDMAYVADIAHDDVRTEGMSYGMMIAV